MFKKPNTISIGGNLGADAVINKAGDANVANFRIANTESYKDKNGELVEKTRWYNIEYWNPTDKQIPHLVKGTEIMIEGSLYTEENTKDDGQKFFKAFIRADRYFLMGGKKD